VSDFASSRRSKVVQSVRDARARIEIRDEMRYTGEHKTKAILNHITRDHISHRAYLPSLGQTSGQKSPRFSRARLSARVRLIDPVFAPRFFRSSDLWSWRTSTKSFISRPGTIKLLPSFPREHPPPIIRTTTSSSREERRRKKDTKSTALRPHATEARPKRGVPCVRAKTWDVFLERRVYEDIILRSGGGVSELRVVVGVCSTTTELDSRLIYILHSVSTNTLKEGRKRTQNSFGRGTKKKNQFLCCSFEKRKITQLLFVKP
jgi:hypothetical protein